MLSFVTRFANIQVSPDDLGVPQVAANDNTLAKILSAVFVIVGSLAVLFVLIGAARYVAANGEPARVTQAKNTILYAIVGVVVSALAFVVVQFVIGRLTGTLT